MGIEHLREADAAALAFRSAALCVQYLPKVTGAAAATVTAIWGPEWFGVEWTHDSIWFLEAGTRPFTMRSLAGRTIPMWVNDADGKERRKNPRAETRVRADNGQTQVLIFRRAANFGERKDVMRGGVSVNVPRSYPGAPGRIAVNRSRGLLRAGDIDPQARNRGWIAPRNVGVRWRHPGLDAGENIVRGIADAAREAQLPVGKVRYLPRSTLSTGADYDILLLRG